MTGLVAALATLILAGLAIFQIALIAKAPIGFMAWGGQHRVLPTKLRIASASSIILYILFALIALSKAGLVAIFPEGLFLSIILWILTAYFYLGILLNGMSPSKYERYVMTPVAATLAILFSYLAIA